MGVTVDSTEIILNGIATGTIILCEILITEL